MTECVKKRFHLFHPTPWFRRKARRARSGHLWIYRSDVTQRPQSESGSVVRVVDHRGRFVARAHYGKESEITLRIVSKDDVEITRDFWLARLRAGARWREQVVSDADAYRLVHAEGDLLPGLIIDRYGDCFALQTLTRGMDSLKAMWAELLVEEFHPRLIVERNDAKVRQLEGLPMTNSLLYPAVGQTGGLPGASQTADEGNGANCQPAIQRVMIFSLSRTGSNSGSTCLKGRRQARSWISAKTARRYARGRGLDCFSFHGSFALHMAKGCERVNAVDISEPAIESARVNAELNNVTNIEFVTANVFDLLRDYDDAGERFDTIVLDPRPSPRTEARSRRRCAATRRSTCARCCC